MRVVKEENLMRKSYETFMRSHNGSQSPKREGGYQDAAVQQNFNYFGMPKDQAVGFNTRYAQNSRALSPGDQSPQAMDKKSQNFMNTMQNFNIKKDSIKEQVPTQNTDKSLSNSQNLTRSQSSQVFLRSQQNGKKAALDADTLYPTSPLNRLYRNNIKVQMGRYPATFFKKVYKPENYPSCAISKINVPGNTTNLNIGKSSFLQTQHQFTHKQDNPNMLQPLSPLKRPDIGAQLLAMNTDKKAFDSQNHQKYFHDYFGNKDKGKRQLESQLPDVVQKHSRDFNILSNIPTGVFQRQSRYNSRPRNDGQDNLNFGADNSTKQAAFQIHSNRGQQRNVSQSNTFLNSGVGLNAIGNNSNSNKGQPGMTQNKAQFAAFSTYQENKNANNNN
ncbi:UNKNOWN [Stylonychia lemnae]|uniref:Uncharacterized protein n=1 Tax=Stylonychia lemnae TaxID=5949 RepID=A0A078AHM3_STYLE|nr:UNKNOWN [Stylonychia lemnae]|eukprot:CDW81366.1 UNKNOWN [Stylonychia lemnae]